MRERCVAYEKTISQKKITLISTQKRPTKIQV